MTKQSELDQALDTEAFAEIRLRQAEEQANDDQERRQLWIEKMNGALFEQADGEL